MHERDRTGHLLNAAAGWGTVWGDRGTSVGGVGIGWRAIACIFGTLDAWTHPAMAGVHWRNRPLNSENAAASTPQNADTPPSVDESRELLRQVHEAVTAGRRSGRVQALMAIVLSLATLTSTWCGYQAARWSGLQSSLQSSADTAERQAAENTIVGLQIRTQDEIMLLEYWRATRDGDERTKSLIELRMSPALKAATQASIREGIFKNPAVKGPLQRPEYQLEIETIAAARRSDAAKWSAEGGVAGLISNDYVLLTLTLASVLFLGGMSSTFSRPLVRKGLGVIAILVFAVAAVYALRLDVLWPKIGAADAAAADAAAAR